MDYHSLLRRQLQTLCKKHGIPANSTNSEMADALTALLKPKPPPQADKGKQVEKRATRSSEPTSDEKAANGKGPVDLSPKNLEPNTKLPRVTRGSGGKPSSVPLPATLKEEKAGGNGELQSNKAPIQVVKTKITRHSASKSENHGLHMVSGEKVCSPKMERRKDRAGGIVLRRGRVKVRSPGNKSRSPESYANNKAHAGHGSCLVDANKMLTRKKKGAVTFSDVLQVDYLSLDEKDEKITGTEQDKSTQHGESFGVARKAPSMRVNTRNASQIMCSQEKPVDAEKTGDITASAKHIVNQVGQPDRHVPARKQGRRASPLVRKNVAATMASEELETFVVVDKLNLDVPLVGPRRSRRLTMSGSDIKVIQTKGLPTQHTESADDYLKKDNVCVPLAESSKRSRRSILAPLELNDVESIGDEKAHESSLKSKDYQRNGSQLSKTKASVCMNVRVEATYTPTQPKGAKGQSKDMRKPKPYAERGKESRNHVADVMPSAEGKNGNQENSTGVINLPPYVNGLGDKKLQDISHVQNEALKTLSPTCSQDDFRLLHAQETDCDKSVMDAASVIPSTIQCAVDSLKLLAAAEEIMPTSINSTSKDSASACAQQQAHDNSSTSECSSSEQQGALTDEVEHKCSSIIDTRTLLPGDKVSSTKSCLNDVQKNSEPGDLNLTDTTDMSTMALPACDVVSIHDQQDDVEATSLQAEACGPESRLQGSACEVHASTDQNMETQGSIVTLKGEPITLNLPVLHMGLTMEEDHGDGSAFEHEACTPCSHIQYLDQGNMEGNCSATGCEAEERLCQAMESKLCQGQEIETQEIPSALLDGSVQIESQGRPIINGTQDDALVEEMQRMLPLTLIQEVRPVEGNCSATGCEAEERLCQAMEFKLCQGQDIETQEIPSALPDGSVQIESQGGPIINGAQDDALVEEMQQTLPLTLLPDVQLVEGSCSATGCEAEERLWQAIEFKLCQGEEIETQEIPSALADGCAQIQSQGGPVINGAQDDALVEEMQQILPLTLLPEVRPVAAPLQATVSEPKQARLRAILKSARRDFCSMLCDSPNVEGKDHMEQNGRSLDLALSNGDEEDLSSVDEEETEEQVYDMVDDQEASKFNRFGHILSRGDDNFLQSGDSPVVDSSDDDAEDISGGEEISESGEELYGSEQETSPSEEEEFERAEEPESEMEELDTEEEYESEEEPESEMDESETVTEVECMHMEIHELGKKGALVTSISDYKSEEVSHSEEEIESDQKSKTPEEDIYSLKNVLTKHDHLFADFICVDNNAQVTSELSIDSSQVMDLDASMENLTFEGTVGHVLTNYTKHVPNSMMNGSQGVGASPDGHVNKQLNEIHEQIQPVGYDICSEASAHANVAHNLTSCKQQDSLCMLSCLFASPVSTEKDSETGLRFAERVDTTIEGLHVNAVVFEEGHGPMHENEGHMMMLQQMENWGIVHDEKDCHPVEGSGEIKVTSEGHTILALADREQLGSQEIEQEEMDCIATDTSLQQENEELLALISEFSMMEVGRVMQSNDAIPTMELEGRTITRSSKEAADEQLLLGSCNNGSSSDIHCMIKQEMYKEPQEDKDGHSSMQFLSNNLVVETPSEILSNSLAMEPVQGALEIGNFSPNPVKQMIRYEAISETQSAKRASREFKIEAIDSVKLGEGHMMGNKDAACNIEGSQNSEKEGTGETEVDFEASHSAKLAVADVAKSQDMELVITSVGGQSEKPKLVVVDMVESNDIGAVITHEDGQSEILEAAEMAESNNMEAVITSVDGQCEKVSQGRQNAAADISRAYSLQQIDKTLLSLRKLRQLCKENSSASVHKSLDNETPAKKPFNINMSAKKQPHQAYMSTGSRESPSASKRSALKTLPSNIKKTPSTILRTPTAKVLHRSRNLIANYEGIEGSDKQVVTPSSRPTSSKKDYARSHHR